MIDPDRLDPARPFATIEQHDEALVWHWNARVRPGDAVFHLGDFAFASLPYIRYLLSRLNGQIKLVPSDPGHDTKWIKSILADDQNRPGNLEILAPVVGLKVHRNLFGLGNAKAYMVLCHYPMNSWHKSSYGSLHVHGHWHGKFGMFTAPRRMDIGLESTDLVPWRIDEVLQAFGAQELAEEAPSD